MKVRHLARATVLAALLLFAFASQAFADTGSLAAVADWTPTRILLGLGGIAFAAALTRAQAG
jgi:hypothetical protein